MNRMEKSLIKLEKLGYGCFNKFEKGKEQPEFNFIPKKYINNRFLGVFFIRDGKEKIVNFIERISKINKYEYDYYTSQSILIYKKDLFAFLRDLDF